MRRGEGDSNLSPVDERASRQEATLVLGYGSANQSSPWASTTSRLTDELLGVEGVRVHAAGNRRSARLALRSSNLRYWRHEYQARGLHRV